MLIDSFSGYATQAGAAGKAATIVAGNSRTIKGLPVNSKAYLLQTWMKVRAAVPTDGARLIYQSQKFHDNRIGLDLMVRQSDPTPLFAPGIKQQVFAQDQLDVTIYGSAGVTDDDVFTAMVYYDTVEGQGASLITHEELLANADNLYSVRFNPQGALAAKAITGEGALNVTQDSFKAGARYALVGYSVNVLVGSFFIKGPNTGNAFIPMPGHTDFLLTRDFFLDLAREHKMPLIPVIEADNKAATTVAMLTDDVPTDSFIVLNFVQLRPGFVPTAR